MERIPCKKCLGKGTTQIKSNNENQSGFNVSVTCPVCGGSGYQGIYGTNNYEQYDDQLTNIIQQKTIIKDDNVQLNIQEKQKIINQIIKYPELFTNGKQFNYIDENIEIFIYLKNQYLFNIKQKESSMLITLKNEYKNKLAEIIINKLKEQHNHEF